MSGKSANGLEESLLRVKQEDLDTLIRTDSAVLLGMKFDTDSLNALAKLKNSSVLPSAQNRLVCLL